MKLSFWHTNSPNFVKFCRIGPGSNTLEETLVYTCFQIVIVQHKNLFVKCNPQKEKKNNVGSTFYLAWVKCPCQFLWHTYALDHFGEINGLSILKYSVKVISGSYSVSQSDVTDWNSDTWLVNCSCSMLLPRVKDCLWSKWWSKQNQRVCSKITTWNDFTVKYDRYLTTMSQENLTKNNWIKTNLSALHRYPMISFYLVTGSVVSKFNTCDRFLTFGGMIY